MTGSMPQSGDRRIVRLSQNVLHLSIGQVISTSLGFLLAVALGRALSPSDFGILYIVGTIYGFAGILIDWGQSTYVIRDTARGRTDEPEFIGATLILRVIGNLAAGAVGIVAALVLGYDKATIQLIALVAVVGFPISLATLFGLWFRGKDRVDLDVLIGLVGKALGVAATILVIGAGGGLFAIVGISAVGSIGGFALSLRLFRSFEIPIRLPPARMLGKLVRVGLPIALVSLSMALQSFADIALLSVLAGPVVVGWLGAARTLLGIFMAPAGIIAGASFPELSRAAQSTPDLCQELSSSSRIILAVSACAASTLFVFADFGVAVTYGRGKFDEATILLQLSALVLPMLFLTFLLANAVFALGRMVAVAIFKVVFMLCGLVVGWFAISYCQTRFGNGAIGTILSYNAMEALMLVALLSLLPTGAVNRTVVGHLGRAYVTFGGVVLVFFALPQLPVWASAPLLGLAFVAVALATQLLLVSDMARISAMLGSIFSNRQRRTPS